ncbi:acyloxyacyl hydrolase [Ottowia sp. GY511]|uniref:Lipid A deacylase n=1 Tax=Ottowia flava TaxID=2675430 RepID=A0ABW4KQ90_9BURK|nr:acyloxyacyl hydrolase [Ottowia sp. GY511]TXK29695.1 acyloxyacyl hydrolase [Ottowia sp. GY511]
MLRAGLAAALGLGAMSSQAAGPDWTLVGGASDESSVKQVGVIAGWTRPEPLWQGDTWRLRLRHEAVAIGWHVPRARDLIEVGYSPVFRLERPLSGGGGRSFFFEGAIGVRLLSHTRVSQEHRMSTAFQFADMLGLGMQWGREGQSTLGLRVQHLSNLGIKKPNPGINFLQLYYTHRF